MASFSRLKQSKVWVSMLVGYFDKESRFHRVLVAIIGMNFYLIIEKGKKETVMIEFDSEDQAKKWVEKRMLNCNLLDTEPFWTRFYSPYATWLEEEFNISGSNLVDKQVTLYVLDQLKQNQIDLEQTVLGHKSLFASELEVWTMDQ
jgi:hypothetical protein